MGPLRFGLRGDRTLGSGNPSRPVGASSAWWSLPPSPPSSSCGGAVYEGLEVIAHRSRRASLVFRYRPYVDSRRTLPTKKAPAEHTSRHDSRLPRKSPFVRFAVK